MSQANALMERPIMDTGIVALGAHLKKLTQLDVSSCNQVTDRGMCIGT
jgi:hypothetical protein